MSTPLRTSLMALSLCLALLLAGCGKKSWPSPRAEEDRFTISQLTAERQGNCLNMQLRLSGNHQNLRGLVLELEGREEPCPGCPFTPTDTIRLSLSSPTVSRDGPRFSITWCGLQPERTYRWRLSAVNVYPSIPDERSNVRRLE